MHLEMVEVNLVPDVDQSSMFVSLDIKLAEDTSLPSILNFKIPIDAQLQTAANRSSDGSLSSAEIEVTADGTWQEISLTTSSLEILIEYDDPNLTQEDDRWVFEFTWLSIYPLDSLYMVVEQPTESSDISTDGVLSRLSDETSNTVYYSGEMGSLDAGETWSLVLISAYDVDTLTNASLEVAPAMPIDENTDGRSPSPLDVVIWLLMTAVAILIIIVLYYWWFRVHVINKHNRIIHDIETMNPEKQVIFCHECGMLSQSGDDYCRNCGTQLRKVGRPTSPPQV